MFSGECFTYISPSSFRESFTPAITAVTAATTTITAMITTAPAPAIIPICCTCFLSNQ